MKRFVRVFDRSVIHGLRKCSPPFARAALFAVFFWFGFLKVIQMSPADELVYKLLESTFPFIEFTTFFIGLGIYEIILGIIFVIPGKERLAIALLIPHMIATFLPFIMTPEAVWSGFLTPTLEGQYIIKNLAIIALALGIAAHLHPFRSYRKHTDSEK